MGCSHDCPVYRARQCCVEIEARVFRPYRLSDNEGGAQHHREYENFLHALSPFNRSSLPHQTSARSAQYGHCDSPTPETQRSPEEELQQ